MSAVVIGERKAVAWSPTKLPRGNNNNNNNIRSDVDWV